jgi:hypothetical protein
MKNWNYLFEKWVHLITHYTGLHPLPVVPLLVPYPSPAYLLQSYPAPTYLSHYLAGQPCATASLAEKKKRNRTFIDPVTEVIRLPSVAEPDSQGSA